MKRLWNALPAGSLCVALCIAGLWISSHYKPGIFRFSRHGERYQIVSVDGQVVLGGAASDAAANGKIRDLTARMSNDDFDWGAPVSSEPWRRGLRPSSPTDQLHDEFLKIDDFVQDADAAEALWLKALDDPHKLFAADWLLAGRTWSAPETRFRMEPFPLPAVNWNVDPKTNQPDVSQWRRVRDEWHDHLDIVLLWCHDGFLLAAALLVPALWITRPPRASARGWAFNAIALISFALCLTAGGFCLASYLAPDIEEFSQRSIPGPSSPTIPPQDLSGHYPWRRDRWIGSSRGRLQFLERDLRDINRRDESLRGNALRRVDGVLRPGLVTTFSGNSPSRYWIGSKSLSLWQSSVHWEALGISYASSPPAAEWPAGYRTLIVSWWTLIIITLLPPALWAMNARRRWRRRCAEGKLCVVCGYDLRATPDKCPECGTVPTGVG